MLLLAAVLACGGSPDASRESPPEPTRPIQVADGTPPTVSYTLRPLGDDTLELAGTATDDRAVTAADWIFVRPALGGGRPDTLRGSVGIVVPARQITFRFLLPRDGRLMTYAAYVTARDSAGNVTAGPPAWFDDLDPRVRLFGLPGGNVLESADTLRQRGVSFKAFYAVAGGVSLMTATLDAGTPGERILKSWPATELPVVQDTARIVIDGPLPAGRHTITVSVTDLSAHEGRASFTRVYEPRIDDVAYSVRLLPAPADAPGGTVARYLASDGTVAGGVISLDGQPYPVVWHAGVPELLPRGQNGPGFADRVNAVGDVLGTLGGVTHAWVAHGPLVRISPKGVPTPGWFTDGLCCGLSVGLNDAGMALVVGNGVFLYDIHAEQAQFLTTLIPPIEHVVALNNRGQVLGNLASGLVIWGPPLDVRPPVLSAQDRFLTAPLALSDAGHVLMTIDGRLALSTPGQDGLLLSDFLGRSPIVPTSAVMDQRGTWVVARTALDTAQPLELLRWRVADHTTRRVVFSAPGWQLEQLVGVNERGQILLNLVDANHAPDTPVRHVAAVLDPPG
ncbi:hypothetical protein J421_0409 [Gemmatirosa kalamazoonensis]|uniref:Uncharacterized protein n=2 Tax=Gemmatirosa kalamazoonensis TaxID=861299 RepID=W0RAY2_9BACT|nr:hypothetical protein J421_0409 [Gemmatirosa kalamazoonensis]